MAVLVACLSGLLLGLSFVEPSLGALVFIAFVPILQIVRNYSFKKIYWLSLIMGGVFFGIANYWVVHFLDNLISDYFKVALFSLIYFIFSAHIICVLMLGVKWLEQTLPNKITYVAVPLFSCVVFHYFPLIFPMHLAITQVGFSKMLQPIAWLSHWSLSAFILLVNIVLARDLLAEPKGPRSAFLWSLGPLETRSIKNIALSASVLIGIFSLWLGVAEWSLRAWRLGIQSTETLTVGFHQLEDPVGKPAPIIRTGYTRGFSREIHNSYALSKAGAKLIIWPESHPKDILKTPWVRNAYQRHSEALGASLMLQELHLLKGQPKRYRNASVFISTDNSPRGYQVHTKIKRIPFGENIPALLDQGALGQWLRKNFSGVLKQLVAGEGPTVFAQGQIVILPQICYEILDAQMVAEHLREKPEVQLIIVQSNDSWFFSHRQVMLHNAFAVMRAVESRRPLMHIVNAGPSYVINEEGGIIAKTAHEQSGAFINDILINTPYQVHRGLLSPQQFISLCLGILVSLLLIHALSRLGVSRKNNRKFPEMQEKG